MFGLKEFKFLAYHKYLDWLETSKLPLPPQSQCLLPFHCLSSKCMCFIFLFLLKYSPLVGNILFLKVRIGEVDFPCISLSFLNWFWNNSLSVSSLLYMGCLLRVQVGSALGGCPVTTPEPPEPWKSFLLTATGNGLGTTSSLGQLDSHPYEASESPAIVCWTPAWSAHVQFDLGSHTGDSCKVNRESQRNSGFWGREKKESEPLEQRTMNGPMAPDREHADDHLSSVLR